MVKGKYRLAYFKGGLPNSSNELLKLKTKSGRLFIDKYGITIEGKKENFEFKYNGF